MFRSPYLSVSTVFGNLAYDLWIENCLQTAAFRAYYFFSDEVREDGQVVIKVTLRELHT